MCLVVCFVCFVSLVRKVRVACERIHTLPHHRLGGSSSVCVIAYIFACCLEKKTNEIFGRGAGGEIERERESLVQIYICPMFVREFTSHCFGCFFRQEEIDGGRTGRGYSRPSPA